MPRVPSLILPALAVALWPVQGQAQEGPSFDCRYAQTATEQAICASPDLARLEMRMYESYLGLVESVGERKARRIADRFLERRQACGEDADCIARRLLISMRVFERRAEGDTRLASQEPSEEELEGLEAGIAAAEPAPAPAIEQEQFASAEPQLPDDIPSPIAREDLAPEPPVVEPTTLEPTDAEPAAPAPAEEIATAEPAQPDLPLAAQAPLPPDLAPLLDDDEPAAEEAATPEEVAAAEPAPTADQLDEAIDGAELASSDEAAPFDQPVSWAFMDLIRHQRAEIQSRLQAAGYYEGPAEGSWDQATLDAFEAFLASEEGQGFDPSTENGAALAIDYIRSDAFAEAHGIALAEAAPEEAAPDPNDPLTSTEW